MAATVRPPREPGSALDGVETAGARAAQAAARPDIRYRLARCRSALAPIAAPFIQPAGSPRRRDAAAIGIGGILPAPSPAPRQHGDTDRIEALHDLVLRSLDDDQAVDVVSIPLTGKSNIADHM